MESSIFKERISLNKEAMKEETTMIIYLIERENNDQLNI
jgi:hypothetical protein